MDYIHEPVGMYDVFDMLQQVPVPHVLVVRFSAHAINHCGRGEEHRWMETKLKQRGVEGFRILFTLSGQPFVFKDVKVLLFVVLVCFVLGIGGCRGPQLVRPLQQCQVVLQRVAQVIAVAAG